MAEGEGLFLSAEIIDIERRTVNLRYLAPDKEHPIECRVSFDSLQDYDRISDRNPTSTIATFHAIRSMKIEPLLRRKYREGKIERDGAIVLRTDDLRALKNETP